MIRALEQCFLEVGHWPATSQSTRAHMAVRSVQTASKNARYFIT